MPGSEKTVKVTLVAVTSPFVSGMSAAEDATRKLGATSSATSKATDKMGDSANRAGSKMGSLGDRLSGAKVAAAGLAGTALVAFLGDAISAAGDLEQSVGGVDAVFGQWAGKVHQQGMAAADALGLSRNEFNQLVTVSGALLKNKGLADFADQSLRLVQIGADLAAQFGGSTKDAVDALNAAMRGESDPIERYGISLNEAAINAELAKKGLTGLTGAALEQAKAQVRLDLITRQSADSVGRFAAESGTAQGQQQRLNAEWEDAKASLGQGLLPAVTAITSALRVGVGIVAASASAWEAIPGPLKAATLGLLAFRLAQGQIAAGIGAVRAVLSGLREALTYAADSAARAGGGFAGLGAGFRTFTGSAGVASSAMGGLKAAGSGLMSLVGGPWSLAVAGLTAAITGWWQSQENAKRAAEELNATLDKQTGAFTEATKSTLIKKMQDDFSPDDWASMNASLDEAGVNMSDMIAAYQAGGPAVDAFKAKFDAWQASAAASGDAELVSRAQALGNTYAAAGRDMDGARVIAEQTAKVQSDLTVKVAAGATAAQAGAGAQRSFADALQDAQGKAAKASDELRDLYQRTQDIVGASMDARSAERDLAAAVLDATSAAKENGIAVNKQRTEFDLATQAGIANSQALDRVATTAVNSAKAQLQNNASVESVTKSMAVARQEFLTAAQSMGISAAAANRMADKAGLTTTNVENLNGTVAKVKPVTQLEIRAKTAEAEQSVQDVLNLMSGLHNKTVIVSVRAKVDHTLDRLGGVVMREGGILVNGVRAMASGDLVSPRPSRMMGSRSPILWNEAAGGESYISLAPSMRPRSLDILAQTAMALGVRPSGAAVAYLAPEHVRILEAIAARPVDARVVVDRKAAAGIVDAGAKALAQTGVAR